MYPQTIASRESLLTPVNNFAATLLSNITATQTTIPISTKQIGSVVLPPYGVVSIGREVVLYTAINNVGPQLLNCVRGYDGTVAVPHSTGEKVEVRWVAAHHNELANLLYTLQVVLGAGVTDGNAQLGNNYQFANLATKLALTLPEIRHVTPATTNWSFQHYRKRVVSVQLYEWDSLNSIYHEFTSPNHQQVSTTAAPSTVTIDTLPSEKEGIIVIN
jgi:hypothetical protein